MLGFALAVDILAGCTKNDLPTFAFSNSFNTNVSLSSTDKQHHPLPDGYRYRIINDNGDDVIVSSCGASVRGNVVNPHTTALFVYHSSGKGSPYFQKVQP